MKRTWVIESDGVHIATTQNEGVMGLAQKRGFEITEVVPAADLAAERDLVQRLAGVAEIGLTITMAPSQRRKFMEDEFGLVKREGKWERVK